MQWNQYRKSCLIVRDIWRHDQLNIIIVEDSIKGVLSNVRNLSVSDLKFYFLRDIHRKLLIS